MVKLMKGRRIDGGRINRLIKRAEMIGRRAREKLTGKRIQSLKDGAQGLGLEGIAGEHKPIPKDPKAWEYTHTALPRGGPKGELLGSGGVQPWDARTMKQFEVNSFLDTWSEPPIVPDRRDFIGKPRIPPRMPFGAEGMFGGFRGPLVPDFSIPPAMSFNPETMGSPTEQTRSDTKAVHEEIHIIGSIISKGAMGWSEVYGFYKRLGASAIPTPEEIDQFKQEVFAASIRADIARFLLDNPKFKE